MDDLPAFTQGSRLVCHQQRHVPETIVAIGMPSIGRCAVTTGGCVAQKLDSVIGVVNCDNDQVCLGVQ